MNQIEQDFIVIRIEKYEDEKDELNKEWRKRLLWTGVHTLFTMGIYLM